MQKKVVLYAVMLCTYTASGDPSKVPVKTVSGIGEHVSPKHFWALKFLHLSLSSVARLR